VKQGTISVVIGSHSILHSFFVWRAWSILYKRYPTFMETICILLHDIGHWGKDYLDNLEEKRKHWELGARIARKLFGEKGFLLIAGHDRYSGYPKSFLYKADKYSWYITPYWWIYSNNIIEPKIKCGMSNKDAVNQFRRWVKESIESGEFRPSHDMYIERLNGDKAGRP